MKPFLLFLLLIMFGYSQRAEAQVLDRLKQKVKTKVEGRADAKADQAIDKTLDAAEQSASGTDGNTSNSTQKTKEKTVTKTDTAPPASPALNVYQNYDFVPGDKILFEDHFTDDQDGEFASHWVLDKGQAVVNKLNGERVMYVTDGNYARLLPRMKNPKYLSDPYTIEYDYYHVPNAYGVVLLMQLYDKEGGYDRESEIYITNTSASFNGTVNGVMLNKDYAQDFANNFDNKWHHVAIAVRNNQLKIYVDQYRVLYVPDTKEQYTGLVFAGIGSEQEPIIFKNVRIASGGDMNMVGKKFTESKIVTHGINFDVDKVTILPQSMGTLNMIVQVLNDNPGLRFEIDGHTDNSGTAQHNQQLSQQRADAVKVQLVKMGVDASRLTTKGLGDTKPIGDNATLEGKANNRRVEFIKL